MAHGALLRFIFWIGGTCLQTFVIYSNRAVIRLIYIVSYQNFRSIWSLPVIWIGSCRCKICVKYFILVNNLKWIKQSDFSLEHSVLTSLYSQFWQSDQHATLQHNLKYFKLREWRVKYIESFKNFIFMGELVITWIL